MLVFVGGDGAGGGSSGVSGPPSGSVLKRVGGGALVLGAATIVMVIVASAVGPFNIPISHTVSTLLDLIGIGDSTAEPTERAIIQSIRLPRIFLAFLVGSALGISGGIMQGLFRNPMADPGIIGVSAVV